MAKIIITDSYGLAYTIGKQYDVPNELAAQLIEAGKAIPAEAKDKQKAAENKDNVEKR